MFSGRAESCETLAREAEQSVALKDIPRFPEQFLFPYIGPKLILIFVQNISLQSLS